MPEDWNLFERIHGDEQAMIFMNTALKETAPLAGLTQLIKIVFNMYSLWDLAGNNSKSAQDIFYSLEDKLILRMKETEDSVYVGRISVRNKMEMYFYAKAAVDWELELREMMGDFPEFRYYYTVNQDENWSFYNTDMYPNPLEEQWMRNAKIAFALQRRGDQPYTAREVEHWLHFSSKLNMDEAKVKALQLGYTVTNAEFDPSKTLNPFVLQLCKKHALDLATVNQITKELFALANESGGTYEGWGTRLKLKLPVRIRFAVLRLWKKRSTMLLVLLGIAASASVACLLIWFPA